MKISSPVIEENGFIPFRYCCEGEDINPPLSIDKLPAGTKTLTLVVEDLDCPGGSWINWLVYNIPATNNIYEDSIPGIEGINDLKIHRYVGPCPPVNNHRFSFRIYALDTVLDLPSISDFNMVNMAMQGHILDSGELIANFRREAEEVNILV